MWNWIKEQWNRFEDWVAEWAPGAKTYIVTGLGVAGSAAVVLQEFVSGIPMSRFVTETQMAIVTMVLFALAFWGRRLANKD